MITKKPLFSWVLERHRGAQILLFFLILSTLFFRVFPLEMQKRIVNQAIALKKLELLLLYCGLYIGAVVLAGVLKYTINLLQEYIGQKLLLQLRTQLYDHILSLPLSFFRRTSAGMVITSLTSELAVIGEFLGGALAIPIINILTLVAFAAYLAYLEPVLAALSFCIYPIEVLIIPFLQKRYNRLNQKRIDLTRSMSNVIGEAVSGMHEVQGNTGRQIENLKLSRHADPLFAVRYAMGKVKYLIKFTNNFFQSLGPFILFLIGGYFTIQGRFDLGALVAFLSAYEKLYDPWKELMDYYQSLQDSRVRYRQIMEYFDEKPEFRMLPDVEREPCEFEGRIEVKDLSFVADGEIRILDKISMEVGPGEQVALVGLSGSGKSTLAMLMGQLYSYDLGHVLVDGMELKELSKLDVGRNVGYVAQYPFIFDGTILENLLYACASLNATAPRHGRPIPERGEVLAAVESVGLSEDVLNIGLNAVLSPDRHEELAARLIGARQLFFARWGKELEDDVDFFDENRYQYSMSIGENIVFGHSQNTDYELERLPRNAFFRKFLSDEDLVVPLLELGEDIARQTVSLLEGLEDEAFFFESSPIRAEEMEAYGEVVERLPRGLESLPSQDRDELLRLALRFIPARHKMASLPLALQARILEARRSFVRRISEKQPDAVTFYRQCEYLFSQNVVNNILFGHAKAIHPHAMERVRDRVVELLRAEALLADLMEVGLQFNVGSKGDRLSGGQKQKVAIARALLKRPHILILDEATASLDNASQGRIQALFNNEFRGKSTLVAVVHRLELVRGYDRIAVMKAGKIVEIGQYDELLNRRGLFYELAHGTE